MSALAAPAAILGVRAVLADRVVDDATVVVEDGRIVSVVERGAAPPGALDGRGAFCLPGIVDTHSDGLEKEAQPRPGVSFPHDFALGSFEGRVRAAGVTTVFHGVAFEHDEHEGRTIELAECLYDAIGERSRGREPLVGHQVLHRLDARDPAGLDALRRRLAAAATPTGGRPPLVSFEDHTPGQGQYADPAVYRRLLEQTQGLTVAEAGAKVDELRQARDALRHHRDAAIAWLAGQAGTGTIRLLAHDLTSADEVADAVRWGAAVAEFPTSAEAAAAARDAGLATVMGAPNVLRGGSHSGNVPAEELVARGLCTALASDYLPSSLIAAAFRLATRGTASLPEAVGLVTAGPAAVAGLDDRGHLEPGQRADVVLATVDGSWPTVRAVFRAPDSGQVSAAAATRSG
jgi:alpha-D-ribose 1-methylphosphonate 5-triphosphate diphosphatase